MASLKEIREKLQQMESRRSGNNNNTQRDNAIYPFWNMDEDKTTIVRFLPDADEENTFYWVERQLIKIPFNGIKGMEENKKVIVQVPCVEMWGDTCPVHQEIRPWFNDPSLEEVARTYWKKRSYIFQGLIRTDGLGEKADDIPENPIRRFIMGKQLFTIIKAALLDVDMEELPIDYDMGTDFKITKTTKGQWADYNSSGYARKESALSQEERDAIEEHGLSKLSDFMPKRPTPEQLNAIFELFEASVEGELYDPAKWGEFYRPPGVEFNAAKKAPADTAAPTVATPAATEATVEAPVAETVVEAPVVEEKEPAMAEAGEAKSTDDILAMIRNRNKQ